MPQCIIIRKDSLHCIHTMFLRDNWKFSIFGMQDESQDFYKTQQLRELAVLNSNFREESPQPSGNISPFTSSGMKRAKTGQYWYNEFTFYDVSQVHSLKNACQFRALVAAQFWIATKRRPCWYFWSAKTRRRGYFQLYNLLTGEKRGKFFLLCHCCCFLHL